MRLVVNTDSLTRSIDPAGFRQSDRCAPVVKAFCHSHGIPYEDTFVCIAVKADKVSPLKPVGEREPTGVDVLYGKYPIELDKRVIEDIQVVTAGDFQTVICEAIRRECSNEDWKKYVSEKVYDLRRLSYQEKERKLDEIAKSMSSSTYAEARIFRTLHTSDKKPNKG